MRTFEVVGVAKAHNGVDDGHPDAIGVPPGQAQVVSYAGLAIIIVGLFFYFRKGKK